MVQSGISLIFLVSYFSCLISMRVNPRHQTLKPAAVGNDCGHGDLGESEGSSLFRGFRNHLCYRLCRFQGPSPKRLAPVRHRGISRRSTIP